MNNHLLFPLSSSTNENNSDNSSFSFNNKSNYKYSSIYNEKTIEINNDNENILDN